MPQKCGENVVLTWNVGYANSLTYRIRPAAKAGKQREYTTQNGFPGAFGL